MLLGYTKYNFQVVFIKRIELCIAEIFVSVAKAFPIFDYKDSRNVTLVCVAKIFISILREEKEYYLCLRYRNVHRRKIKRGSRYLSGACESFLRSTCVAKIDKR